MLPAYGLYSHIRANRVRSMVLIAGFVALLHALQFSALLVANAFGGGDLPYIISRAASQFWSTWPLAMVFAAAWFAIAFLFHQSMIRSATGARGVTRQEAPELYNALETLCISRGITMPKLQIIETPALNAYAAGLRDGEYVVAVTRGLIETLTPAEIEAVLGHELTHIRNRDTQLMVVAIIFAGIFGFIGDMFVRNWDFPYGWSPRDKHDRGQGPWDSSGGGWQTTSGGGRDSRSDRDGGGSPAGAILAILLAIAIVLISWGISTLIRFALSRSREYLADAGAVELTKNPDAMISALRKIEKNAQFDVPSRMEAFFIENPLKQRISGLLATHPDVDDRIAALVRYARGRDLSVPSG